LYQDARKRYQEQGDVEGLSIGRALLESQQNISLSDRERLLGYLDGEGRIILPEPQSLLTVSSKMPGIDGQKMSKTYNNTIALREDPDEVERKIRTMPTDPARVRRTDPGDPEKCPVWEFHQVYTDDETCKTLDEGCRTAAIGCIDCKQYIIDAIQAELKPIQQRVREYLGDLGAVDSIITEGCEAARDVAQDTIEEVRKVMGLTGRK
ncbi:MAG TPA: tryptophan--tRNA ligase, partial [Gammaproteobacteria bacterium]